LITLAAIALAMLFVDSLFFLYALTQYMALTVYYGQSAHECREARPARETRRTSSIPDPSVRRRETLEETGTVGRGVRQKT
jgi:hypothetical protein